MLGFLVGRRLVRLQAPDLVIDSASLGNLSALAACEAGGGPVLWLAGDEAIRFGSTADEAAQALKRNAILILRPDWESSAGAGGFALSEVVPLRALIPNVALAVDKKGHEEEVDIEGLDLDDEVLWVTGSHSSKRKKPKGGDDAAARLAVIATDPNRALLARIPISGGRPVAAALDANDPERMLTAAVLPLTGAEAEASNALTDALRDDPHLGPFVRPLTGAAGEPLGLLPGKDNGFDIEGIAVRRGRVYLGLRGPVLRGWAMILVIRPEDDGNGQLHLIPEAGGKRVVKLFVHLHGMGVRDLAFDGDDLLILAGPTMDVDGTQAVWRLTRPEDLTPDSLSEAAEPGSAGAGRLSRLFDIPTDGSGDRAEGLCRFDQGGERVVLITYDQTGPLRHLPGDAGMPRPEAVYLDLFRLPPQ